MASQLGSSSCLPNHRFFRHQFYPTSGVIASRNLRFRSNEAGKELANGLKWVNNHYRCFRLNKAAKLYTSVSDLGKLVQGRGNAGLLPLRAKPGSDSEPIELVEDGKLESLPSSKPGMSSLHWPVAPLVLIVCLMYPFFMVQNVWNMPFGKMEDVPYAEHAVYYSMEAAFYGSLAALLAITDRVEIPSLQFSAKRSLPTGLGRYVFSSFLNMSLKFVVPVCMILGHWDKLSGVVPFAVAPFLAGCFAQFVCDVYLKVRGSYRWPPVLIILQVYRLYQLTKAAHFIKRVHEGFVWTEQVCPELANIRAMFQVMCVVCLWALITSILRIYLCRPVEDSQ